MIKTIVVCDMCNAETVMGEDSKAWSSYMSGKNWCPECNAKFNDFIACQPCDSVSKLKARVAELTAEVELLKPEESELEETP